MSTINIILISYLPGLVSIEMVKPPFESVELLQIKDDFVYLCVCRLHDFYLLRHRPHLVELLILVELHNSVNY